MTIIASQLSLFVLGIYAYTWTTHMHPSASILLPIPFVVSINLAFDLHDAHAWKQQHGYEFTK